MISLTSAAADLIGGIVLEAAGYVLSAVGLAILVARTIILCGAPAGAGSHPGLTQAPVESKSPPGEKDPRCP